MLSKGSICHPCGGGGGRMVFFGIAHENTPTTRSGNHPHNIIYIQEGLSFRLA